MKAEELRLYLVTGRYDYDQAAFLKRIALACQHGVTLVQLREKTGTTHDFYQLALAVKEVTDQHQVPLIINDRVDICLAVDAAGVHIGDDELPVSVTRQLIGSNKWLGVSAKTLERAIEAEQAGADYLGVGAIYPTKTKDNPILTSLTTLSEISQTVGIPVVAIGGIALDNVATFKGTGIAGVALVSELMLAQDVATRTAKLKAEVVKIID